MNSNLKIAIFAGGCFWCTEAVFKNLKGVISVVPGYTGGTIENPTYSKVSNGNTGHAEAIKIEYDPDIIFYKDLLTIFFYTHDPTTLNQQGNDVGTQYRSAIYYIDNDQKQDAENMIKELTDVKAYPNPFVTEVAPFTEFYEAEDYHHDYYERNKEQRYCDIIITPKLDKLQKRFSELLK